MNFWSSPSGQGATRRLTNGCWFSTKERIGERARITLPTRIFEAK